jgi:hypothetical protein
MFFSIFVDFLNETKEGHDNMDDSYSYIGLMCRKLL